MLSNCLALLAALILYSPFPKVSGLLADQASESVPWRQFFFSFFKEMLIYMGQTSALRFPLLLLFQIDIIEIPWTWWVSGLTFLPFHHLALCLSHGTTVRLFFLSCLSIPN